MSQSHVVARRRTAPLTAIAGAAYVAAWAAGLADRALPLLLFWVCAVGIALGRTSSETAQEVHP